MKKITRQKVLAVVVLAGLILSMSGCGKNASKNQAAKETKRELNEETNNKQEGVKETEIQVFIAASLNTVMQELAKQYEAAEPNVKITYNVDSSGTLLTQIQEGYECDIFFSAAQKQMDILEAESLVQQDTRADVVNNQLVVVSLKDSGTKVTGLSNLADAKSIALAAGSVPVGKYTRIALRNTDLLDKTEQPEKLTTKQVSTALGGVEISEQDNVSKVLMAVMEGSCEVGTTYYSDTYGYEDKLDILQTVSYDLTGNIVYPVCRVVNEESEKLQTKAADDFYKFILSNQAKEIFKSYYFDTEIE